ncbi:nuclease-related domain-containing protein [Ramlibacter sp. 2FC]|uniref:nuclease-related domain-containing protein n=1 Tax=Ramlibacter sp. 2FC TaxID=2502188 RepID=UPI00148521EB|nr:nuclease-related domain-containing protein [Ramlibacter sp. 2FC]
MKHAEERSPLERAAPLRVPGQSLTDELDDVVYDHVLSPLFLAVSMALLAVLEWWRYVSDAKPSPWVFTAAAVATFLYAVFKVRRTRRRIRLLKLGRDGERVVAQYLEWFRTSGFFVFHDVPSGDANLDHVLIGPRGVFSIETKTLSKPRRGDCKVSVVNGVVLANGRKLDRDPLVQAKAQAGWLRSFLTGSRFDVSVWPVVLFPGWFVSPFDSKGVGAWVLEPKALNKFIENEPERYTREQVQAMASALSSYIRMQNEK